MQLQDDGERTVVYSIGSFLVCAVALSTVLHHCFPRVLGVVPCAGAPYCGWRAALLLDLAPFALAAACFWHARRSLGLYAAVMFLAGSFCLTGLEENTWILLGRHLQLLAGTDPRFAGVTGTYYFTRGSLWFGEVPVYICLAWFFIAYCSVYIANVLLPRAGIWARAVLSGLLAMDLDLWLDPVQVSPAWESWRWLTNEPLKVLSIPLTNFAGWFLLIFLFAMLFDRLAVWRAKAGPARAALRLFGALIAFEAGILLLFGAYGSLIMRLLRHPVNLTVWGI